MQRRESGFDWSQLLLGIIYIIVGFITLTNPLVGVTSIVYIIAFGIIIKGIFELVFRHRFSELFGNSPTWLLVIGIIDLVIGILLLFNIYSGVIALPFLYAAWVFVDSIRTLFNAFAFRKVKGFRFWVYLIIGIIGIIIGIFLIFNPIVSVLTVEILVGIYFITAGIGYIIDAF